MVRVLAGGAPEHHMSRTDKTKPMRVRMIEHGLLAHHEHRIGICNLPDSPLVDQRPFHFAQDCYWRPEDHWWPCCRGCSCRMCTGYWGRRAERRASRHAAKAWARKVTTESDWDTEGPEPTPLKY